MYRSTQSQEYTCNGASKTRVRRSFFSRFKQTSEILAETVSSLVNILETTLPEREWADKTSSKGRVVVEQVAQSNAYQNLPFVIGLKLRKLKVFVRTGPKSRGH